MIESRPTTPAPIGPLALVSLLIASAHLTLYPKIADLDGFYHMGHAAAYLEGSIFDTSLPWATQSVIGELGADIWWGFHVVLGPFAMTGNVEWGIRVAALFLTCLLAVAFYWVLRRHEIAGAGWWTAALLVAVPNVLFRYLMLRPHVLSLGLGLLLLSLLVRGKWWHALIASAAITWLHLGMFWLAPGIAVAYGVVRAVETALLGPDERGRVAPTAAITAVLAGTVIGWALRPHPLDAGVLASVQIVRLLAEKATEEPLTFAPELYPLPPLELLRTSWLFLAAWLAASAVAVAALARGRIGAVPREHRTLLATAMIISATFLALTLFSARRAMVEWVGFGSLVLAIVFAHLAPRFRTGTARAAVAVLLVAHLGWGAWRHTLNVDRVAFAPGTLAEVAAFLEMNSEPGEVVFHAKWDNFGPLFARNRTNFYLGGMDPVFQLAHDPARYWEFFYLSTDATSEWTCDAFPCATGNATDTHLVLTEHFGARWVVVEPRRNPRLSLYLLNDERYELALETEREAVFEVVSPASGQGG